MITNTSFMVEASEKLYIPQEVDETEQEWHKRIAYSLIGGHMLTSLYDFDDDLQLTENNKDETVSTQHVLKRGEDLAKALGVNDFNCNNLRELLLKTGYMLHKNNRLTYPSKTTADDGCMSFVRGIPPWEKICISGNGLYSFSLSHSGICAEKMFQIEEQEIKEWFENFTKKTKWEEAEYLPQNVDFLNINHEAKNGYWQTKPPKQGITLCRTKGNVEKEYTILRISSIIEKCPLPNWQTENGEYRRITIALRIANGNMPTVTVLLKKYTARIVMDYLLPSSEQSFVELYSWPTTGDSHWRRTVAIALYPTFKRIFNRLGFIIREVQ